MRISQEKKDKIAEQILACLYNHFPKQIFQQQYPNEKLILINRDKYKSIEKLYQYIIPNWAF